MDKLSDEVICVPLDYTDDRSQSRFLEQLASWSDLKLCILWIHSNAWEFSKRIIEAVSHFPEPPPVIHIVGSSNRPHDRALCSGGYKMRFTAVQLGSVQTATGARWLTHKESSRKVASTLSKEYPNLYVLT